MHRLEGDVITCGNTMEKFVSKENGGEPVKYPRHGGN